jgi:hypothetical protein
MAKQNEKKTKGAGGKLARSEIIQARLSPRTRFTVELLSRIERRTVSSLIETLIHNAAQTYSASNPESDSENGKTYTLPEVINKAWHVEEPIRLVSLALVAPELLSPDEERICSLIFSTNYFWKCIQVQLIDQHKNELGTAWRPVLSLDCLIKENLLEHWDTLQKPKTTRVKLPFATHIGEKLTTPDNKPIKQEIVTVDTDMDYRDLNPAGQKVWVENMKAAFEIHKKEIDGKGLARFSQEEFEIILNRILNNATSGDNANGS